MTVTAEEFIRRFLVHILPAGFMKIRHYGLLGNRNRTKKLIVCKSLTNTPIIEKVKVSIVSLIEKILGKYDYYTKITKEGNLALGISYYFKTEDERSLLMHCNSFYIEGFVALKRKTNVYGFMCRVDRVQDEWVISEGNTYRIYSHTNIKSLVH